MNKRARIIIGGLVALVVILATVVGVQAMSGTFLTIAGVGGTQYVDEVDVIYVRVTGPDKVKTQFESTATTEADYVYDAVLLIDDLETLTSIVSWTAGQIPGTKKTLTFSTSTTAGTSFDIDVRR